eukprot:7253836-Pyramimonas_sp.AAC.1
MCTAFPGTSRALPHPAHKPTKSVSSGAQPSRRPAAALPCTSHPASDIWQWLRRDVEVRTVRVRH